MGVNSCNSANKLENLDKHSKTKNKLINSGINFERFKKKSIILLLILLELKDINIELSKVKYIKLFLLFLSKKKSNKISGPFIGHKYGILSLIKFNDDLLISGNSDNFIKVWNIILT